MNHETGNSIVVCRDSCIPSCIG